MLEEEREMGGRSMVVGRQEHGREKSERRGGKRR
jgi:hypothetical protein